jgi:hypothetical protein
VDFNAGQERFKLPGIQILCPVKFLSDDIRVFAENVVVAKEQMQPSFLVKALEQVEDTDVGLANVFKTVVFEEFIAIADFDVREAFMVIVLEGVTKKDFIVYKVVGPGTIPAMNIAEEDQPGSVVEGNPRSVVEKISKVLVG